jgi:hypothetical protein
MAIRHKEDASDASVLVDAAADSPPPVFPPPAAVNPAAVAAAVYPAAVPAAAVPAAVFPPPADATPMRPMTTEEHFNMMEANMATILEVVKSLLTK